ncbi:hypothetical protein C8J56DRAFT_1058844 [Mycena floridula]|nr:hypothetical protein C8J56DRAFT_1058844 [Mycena floridula]
MIPLLVVLASTISLVHSALPLCSKSLAGATSDYVVVGSGAGGGPVAARLAEAGFSVLVIDAGHSVVNFNTTIPAYNALTYNDPELELNYTISDYPAGFRIQKNDTWYPRARAIGGCTVHNAMANNIGGTEGNFNEIAETFNDQSWSRTNMQNYFKLLEHNLYIDQQNPDHGFDGWLSTSVAANQSISEGTPPPPNPPAATVASAIQNTFPFVPDFNSLNGTSATGYGVISSTVNENNTRSSIHERLLEVSAAQPQLLKLSVDTLATKILLCQTQEGDVQAYGVEIAPGAALPVAANFKGRETLVTKQVIVKREVIVSAGAFQSPQLLMLSGIGDPVELAKNGIDTVVNLPGVGKNLQDNDELPMIWQLKPLNTSDGLVCKLSSDPTQDQCLAEWLSTGHRTGLSAAGEFGITSRSDPELSEPDFLVYGGPFFYIGFLRGQYHFVPPPINVWSLVSLLGPAKSKGTVSLTGSHPQDLLDIQKQRFQSEEAQGDVVKYRGAIQRARAIMAQPEIAENVVAELFPGPDVVTDDQMDEYIYERAFGHHACCTNAIGPANDTLAVLNENFQVRGVKGLRVVDASSWPAPIGHFPTTPTYTMSEKAADVIIQSAKGN